MEEPIHIDTFRMGSDTWVAAYSEAGLTGIWFPGRFPVETSADTGVRPSKQIQSWQKVTREWVKSYLQGKQPDIASAPPLDLQQGTPFQQSVWNALRSIPYGATLSYGEIANKIGKPKAVRATGGACGANPIPLIIPCHRVLAANRKLGGFSGGIEWKQKLLALESIEI